MIITYFIRFFKIRCVEPPLDVLYGALTSEFSLFKSFTNKKGGDFPAFLYFTVRDARIAAASALSNSAPAEETLTSLPPISQYASKP